MLTTQDLKDYDELMQLRMNVVNEKNIKLSDIQEIVRTMEPFEGAENFLGVGQEQIFKFLLFQILL